MINYNIEIISLNKNSKLNYLVMKEIKKDLETSKLFKEFISKL